MMKMEENYIKVEYQDWITREDLKANPEKIYVFGDNDKRIGNGGQAKECRGEPNAYGITVKNTPGVDDTAYYTDDTFESNVFKIHMDIRGLYNLAKTTGKTVIFPSAGVGTGLALLKEKAPLTFAYLNAELKTIGITNGKE